MRITSFITTIVFATISMPVFAEADLDCKDFSSQREAQDFFESRQPGDPHDLDRDNDGLACESLP